MTSKQLNKKFNNMSSRSNFFIDNFNFILNDSVSKNTVIILLTLGIAAAAGFIFTVIAAKMYTIESVGIASLLFSYANFVVLVTRFGTEQSMVRYYDERNKSSILSSSIFITTVPALIFSFILILFSYSGVLISNFLLTYSVIFLFGVTLSSISLVCGGFFLANSKPVLYLLQNSIISSRFIFLFIFVPLGVFGIFSSLVVATLFSVLFSIILLFNFGIKFQIPDKTFISKTFHYSLSNYISDCLLTAPIYLIPILVFFVAGQKDTAIYSVSYAFASICFMIPLSVGTALFISGCQEKTKILSTKSIIVISLAILLGIILIFFYWGSDILNVLGPDYLATSGLTVIIMISSLFALFFQIYSAELKIAQSMKKLLVLNGIFFITLMIFSYLFIIKFGLYGSGFAWISAYAICFVLIVFDKILKKKLPLQSVL